MFMSKDEESVLRKYRHQELLNMFRKVLTRISNLKQSNFQIQTSANFYGDEFRFEITVFTYGGTNTSLTIYDFWDVKKSAKLIDGFIQAIKKGDFNAVEAACKMKPTAW